MLNFKEFQVPQITFFFQTNCTIVILNHLPKKVCHSFSRNSRVQKLWRFSWVHYKKTDFLSSTLNRGASFCYFKKLWQTFLHKSLLDKIKKTAWLYLVSWGTWNSWKVRHHHKFCYREKRNLSFLLRSRLE